MCLTGGNNNNKYNKNNYFISVNTLIGVGFGLINCVAMALVNVSNKNLVKNKILIVTQMLYFGIVKIFLFFYLFNV